MAVAVSTMGVIGFVAGLMALGVLLRLLVGPAPPPRDWAEGRSRGDEESPWEEGP